MGFFDLSDKLAALSKLGDLLEKWNFFYPTDQQAAAEGAFVAWPMLGRMAAAHGVCHPQAF